MFRIYEKNWYCEMIMSQWYEKRPASRHFNFRRRWKLQRLHSSWFWFYSANLCPTLSDMILSFVESYYLKMMHCWRSISSQKAIIRRQDANVSNTLCAHFVVNFSFYKMSENISLQNLVNCGTQTATFQFSVVFSFRVFVKITRKVDF